MADAGRAASRRGPSSSASTSAARTFVRPPHARRTGVAGRIGRATSPWRASRRAAQGARCGVLRRVGQGTTRSRSWSQDCTSASTVVVFDQALSPAQQRNLERHLASQRRRSHRADPRDLRASGRRATKASCRSNSRAAVPVDDAARARLEPPRTPAGGIGNRGGPGEAQIETRPPADRRAHQEHEGQAREGQAPAQHAAPLARAQRQTRFRVSLVGYTNAGKSTLFNALTHAGPTSPTSSSRRSTRRRAGQLYLEGAGRGRSCCRTRSASSATCRTRWSRRSRRPCRRRSDADLLLHVVDGREPGASPSRSSRSERACSPRSAPATLPQIVVFNKIDLQSTTRRPSRYEPTCVDNIRAVVSRAACLRSAAKGLALLRDVHRRCGAVHPRPNAASEKHTKRTIRATGRLTRSFMKSDGSTKAPTSPRRARRIPRPRFGVVLRGRDVPVNRPLRPLRLAGVAARRRTARRSVCPQLMSDFR